MSGKPAEDNNEHHSTGAGVKEFFHNVADEIKDAAQVAANVVGHFAEEINEAIDNGQEALDKEIDKGIRDGLNLPENQETAIVEAVQTITDGVIDALQALTFKTIASVAGKADDNEKVVADLASDVLKPIVDSLLSDTEVVGQVLSPESTDL